jgi:NAD(P)-dependent dehydrogenase (short-subunit alcohol dehydrogenase family)
MMTFKDRLYPPSGLRVLISAGASGIGATIASAFVESGAKVHVCDVDPAALEAFQRRFPSALTTLADVADGEQVAAVFQSQCAHFGGLDVLVNCAGIAGPTGGIEKIRPEDWSRTVEVNLGGQFRCLHHAVPMLRESPSANVICMSSVAGRLGYALRTPYASTKWAISGLVKSLAIELGPNNIRVNALLPGVVEGPRMDSVIRARAEQKGITEGAMREDFLQKVSLRRMVTADDVALMCLFLCSPAGRNISGQTISVDGNVEYL